MKKFIGIINEGQIEDENLEENQRGWMSTPAAAVDEESETFQMGALIRGQFRKLLEKAKFEGHVNSYHETKNFLESEFIVKARPVVIKALRAHVTKWQAAMEASDKE